MGYEHSLDYGRTSHDNRAGDARAGAEKKTPERFLQGYPGMGQKRVARRDQFTEDSRRRRQDIVCDVPRKHQHFPYAKREGYEDQGEAVLPDEDADDVDQDHRSNRMIWA